MEGNALVSNDMLNDLAIAIKGCMTNPPSEGMRVQDMVENVRGIVDGKLTFGGGFVIHTDARSIVSNAFSESFSLTSVSLPSCVTVGVDAFSACSALTSVSLPSCTDIATGAFGGCTGLLSVSLPACISIGQYAFSACSTLKSVSLPVCTEIWDYAFVDCDFETLSLPACTTVREGAFVSCGRLTSVSLPVCKFIGGSAFDMCNSLAFVDVPAMAYRDVKGEVYEWGVPFGCTVRCSDCEFVVE